MNDFEKYKQAIDMIEEYCKLYESKLNITIPIIKHIIDKVIGIKKT